MVRFVRRLKALFVQAINCKIIIQMHKYRLLHQQFLKKPQMGHRAEVEFGFFSSGRNKAILESSGIDPVDSNRLIKDN